MTPDVWLTIKRISDIRKKKWPGKSKRDFINLAVELFKRDDLSRAEVSRLGLVLEKNEDWPGKIQQAATATAVDPASLEVFDDSTPDWLLEAITMLLETQTGSSVLDLFCGNARFAAYLPPGALYEGHDYNSDKLSEASAAFPQHVFEQTQLHDWLTLDPQSKYNMVFLHGPNVKVEAAYPCIATQKPGDLIFDQAIVEVGTRCLTHGGFLVSVNDKPDFTYNHFEEALCDYLDEEGVVLLDTQITEGDRTWHVCLFRKGVKRGEKHTNLTFADPQAFTDWCLSDAAPKLKVPVSTEDPRPMSLKTWDITVGPIATLGKMNECGTIVTTTELYRSKGAKLGIRWANASHALSWAIHQALYGHTTARPWHNEVKVFAERLPFFDYMQVRGRGVTPNQLLNLPPELRVVEEPALKAHLDRKARAIARHTTPYPERTTMENRYLTLGPGSRLVQQDEHGQVTKRYTVKFAETDFVNHEYPRLHLEEQP